MTVMDAIQRPQRQPVASGLRPARSRPRPGRPAGGAVRYRGTGVAASQAAHRRAPVSMPVTVAIACAAALITAWLGMLGQSRAAGGAAAVPERLAVVHVQEGESLRQLAARMAPGAPVGHTVARIQELNGLRSVAVLAGQTLIAPAE